MQADYKSLSFLSGFFRNIPERLKRLQGILLQVNAMEEKITLDRKTFRMLSSGTRIDIAKKLYERRMTLSELSGALGMSPSSVKEHMDALRSAGLVEQHDEGRKWKYYALTGKGRYIINPAEKKVFIILGISILAMIGSAGMLMQKLGMPDALAMEKASAAANIATVAANTAGAVYAVPYLEIFLVIISVLAAGACIGYLMIKRKPAF